ncbi:MAG TPA: lanthionine synthetase C family protein [Chloroflexota bacterium]
MPADLSWSVALDGAERDRALAIVQAIATDLRARFDGSSAVDEHDAWSLALGRSGVALFFGYLAEALGDTDARSLAGQLIEDSLESAVGVAPLDCLFTGVAGVGWVLAHLDLFDLSDGDPNDAVDAALLDIVSAPPEQGEYDLVAGLTGVGVYALERLPRRRAVELVRAVAGRLAELARADPAHPLWWTSAEGLQTQIRTNFPDGAWNLGLAHGAPGVIGFLARACAAGIDTHVVRPLLEAAVEWYLGQQVAFDDGPAFPGFAAPAAKPSRSRLAWCYGDPGVAGSLFQAGKRAAMPTWQAAAVTIGERAAKQSLADSGVVDAGICHGSAGLAHIYNRLWQATGSPALRDATAEWLERVMRAHRPGQGVGGFQARNGARWVSDPGFLTGAAGVGLVLLAAATPVEPLWDRVLLLS